MRFNGVLNRVFGWPFREAVRRDDDIGWRSVGSGDELRTLPEYSQHKMQQLAFNAWRMNPLGKALIEIPVGFLTAGGVRVSCSDAEIEAMLQEFWADPVNDMEISLPRKIRELAIYGEQCWPAFVGVDGFVRLGYLDPAQIKTVHTDPDNAAMIIGVETKYTQKAGKAFKYRVIVGGGEDIFTERTRALRETFDDGECFFFRVNGITNSPRGHSDLLPVLDSLTRYQQGINCDAARWKEFRSFNWHLTLEGASDAVVAERAKTLKPPRPGDVQVTNGKERWEAVTPRFGAYETSNLARLLRNHILSAVSLPEHWLGGGGDVNRATAAEMDSPAMRTLECRQGEWTAILRAVLRWQVIKRFEVLNRLGGADAALERLRETPIRIEWPEMLSKDTGKYAAALSQTVITAATAIDRGLLSRETAVRLIAQAAAQFGLEVDPQVELELADGEERLRSTADLYRMPDGAS